VNPGYRVARNPSYQGIEANYRRTFRTLEALKPDVWLAPHNEFYGLDAKLARAAKDGVKAWVDPEGYRKWVAAQKERFETGAEKERAGWPAGAR
jgi:metallo-beta-lactamase class B